MATLAETLDIDCRQMTMNTTLAQDKVLPPHMVSIQNMDLSGDGNIQKRQGGITFGTGLPLASSQNTTIEMVTPFLSTDNGIGTLYIIAIVTGNGTMYKAPGVSGAWTNFGSATINNIQNTPWHLAWGRNSGGTSVLFAVPNQENPGNSINQAVIMIEPVGGTTTALTSNGGVASAVCCEYFMDKLFLGNTVEGTTNYYDRLRWSKTGDPNTWNSTDASSLDLRIPGGGNSPIGGSNFRMQGIRGLRVYRNQLYIGTEVDLRRLTGTSSATFGSERIRFQNFIAGCTMWSGDDWLFFCDRDGIWQFDGSTAQNLTQIMLKTSWESLSAINDIDRATASIDNQLGLYSVWFPNAQQLWQYYWREQQWTINAFNFAGLVQCIGPCLNTSLSARSVHNPFVIGTYPRSLNSGGGYVLTSTLLTGASNNQDNGNVITAFFQTGILPLGSLGQNGRPGARARITAIYLYAAQQTAAGTITLDMTVDGVAQTQQSVTVTSNGLGSADNYPTRFKFPLPGTNVGEYFQFKVQDATSNVRCDLRRFLVRYQILDDA